MKAFRPSSSVECELLHPTLFVSDVRAAVGFYTDRLGFRLGFTWGEPPTAAGVNLDRVSIHLTQGTPNPTGCEVYFVVGDVDELHRAHSAQGVKVSALPANKPWAMREYAIQDLDGYRLKFGQHAPLAEPKIEISREDVPVRLEKRLAAVLRELAVHKRMTVSECLEETLLHTFEPVDTGGVASPHTTRDLECVRVLKNKHGIDYDAHSCSRFLERA